MLSLATKSAQAGGPGIQIVAGTLVQGKRQYMSLALVVLPRMQFDESLFFPRVYAAPREALPGTLVDGYKEGF